MKKILKYFLFLLLIIVVVRVYVYLITKTYHPEEKIYNTTNTVSNEVK